MVRQVMGGGHTVKAAAAAFTVCEKTVRKWVQRYRQAGRAGLMDHSSKPRCSPRLIAADRHVEVWRWRAQGHTYAEIAKQTGLSEATLSRILRARRSGPAPTPVVRYERATPGELLHLDIKKLGRIERPGHRVTGDRSTRVKGSGWECVHVCIDDHSRVAFAQIKADQKRHTAVDFLEAALARYASLGVKVQSIMTDNGPCYHSAAFRKACSAHGIKHLFTKPYTPRTNGKAERFIQSSLREWAYARPYNHSDQRAAALPLWLHRYNWHRPHRSLNRLSPISRLNLQDNLLTTHT